VGRKTKIGLEVIIESVLGLTNIDEIAGSSKRLESLHFGAADYAASQGMRTTNIGGGNADYVMLTDKDEKGERVRHWNDLWHFPLFRMVQAARAHGLMAIDGPFGDYGDPDGFRVQANRTAILGCEGKWAIHPSRDGRRPQNGLGCGRAERRADRRRLDPPGARHRQADADDPRAGKADRLSDQSDRQRKTAARKSRRFHFQRSCSQAFLRRRKLIAAK